MTHKLCISVPKVAVAAALVSVSLAHAGGLYLYEMGTSDLGFAGAGTAARAEDASTVYANPAGMTRLAGDQWTVGGQLLYGSADYKLDGNGLLQGSNPGNVIGWLPAASAFYSHSASDQLKVGVGMYGNFGLALDFGDQWAGNNVMSKSALMALTLQPTAAYRIDKQWSVGGGITANYGQFKLERVPQAGGTREQKATDWAFGARLSVLFEPDDATRWGVVWGSKADFSFDIDPSFNVLGHTATVPVGVMTAMPQQLMASVYHRLDDNWALMGNLGWQNWHAFSGTSLDVNGSTSSSKLELQDTWHTAFGLQRTLNATTKLNAGVAYDTSFFKDQNKASFAMPGGAAWRLGTGLQIALGNTSNINVSAEYLRAQSSADPNPLVSGRYDTPQMFFMAVSYNSRF